MKNLLLFRLNRTFGGTVWHLVLGPTHFRHFGSRNRINLLLVYGMAIVGRLKDTHLLC